MRTHAEIKQEHDAEVERRKLYAPLYRDNLVALMQWPEANNFTVHVYEFDPGPRLFRFGRKHSPGGAKADMVEYNLHHARTLVVITTKEMRPTLYVPFVYWLKEPFDPTNKELAMYIPPYSNVSGNGQVCTGQLTPECVQAADISPAAKAKQQDSILSHILYGSLWTDSIIDRAIFIADDRRRLLTPHDRFKKWETFGDKALDHFLWDESKSVYGSWGSTCNWMGKFAKDFLGR